VVEEGGEIMGDLQRITETQSHTRNRGAAQHLPATCALGSLPRRPAASANAPGRAKKGRRSGRPFFFSLASVLVAEAVPRG